MSTLRSTLLIVTLAAGAGALGLTAGRWWTTRIPEGPAGLEIARIGDLAPPLSLPDLEGRVQAPDPWRGRARLINFWATWCSPCIEEIPLLDAFAHSQGTTGVQVIGVALDDPAAVRDFLRQIPARYPQLTEAPGRSDSSVRHGNTRNVLPFTVLIDDQDRIRRVKVGAFPDLDALRAWASP